MANIYQSKEELVEKVKTIIGKRIGDYEVEGMLNNQNSKGWVGHIMEQGVFGYEINNKRQPDFDNIGVELKATGYKWVRNGKQVSAKERLVITMINYFDDINTMFYDSHCFSKIDKILLILYEYEKQKARSDYIITNYYFYEYDKIPSKDKLIIENDWQTIISKIKNGKAHELSEGDTFYLGACPKGVNKDSVTEQPFSEEPAMKRAYSLKTTYMTNLLRTQVFHEVESKESFVKNLELLKTNNLDDLIYQAFHPFKGKSLTEIDELVGEEVPRKGNKQYIRSYISRMLKVGQDSLDSLEEFSKANIKIKTIRISKNGKIKESMSFPAFDFEEVANETWEESDIRNMFSSTIFLFVVFEEIDDSIREYKFKGAKLWNMPTSDLENEIRWVWERTNHILNNELILSIKGKKIYNNFPKMSDSKISHVRPHAKNRSVTNQLPKSTNIIIDNTDGTVDSSIYTQNHRFTKQCFWLNSDYVLSIIKKYANE
ncbi:hypothetical protein AOC36_10975 [Erysipelothrix larvae]|uniref:DNA mismatch repair MutH/Type II restriction enzyme Sau3AI domain-containing protein n=1 Tax=Erysipelothrix larvae TaxID=1514105 RepID=A0A0X8H1R7_9FIRM|nr:Sau3AI family type II restriction endonuclease [Erysipelothrix larvae]AMC94477.1 hypothetical protein AOC36_10975 [Erysipelothrix larvae]